MLVHQEINKRIKVTAKCKITYDKFLGNIFDQTTYFMIRSDILSSD